MCHTTTAAASAAVAAPASAPAAAPAAVASTTTLSGRNLHRVRREVSVEPQ